METYKIEYERENNILRVGFGPKAAQNDEIVRDALKRLTEMKTMGFLDGGSLIKVSGPASMPVTAVIVHEIVHLFETVAIYDPKLPGPKKYVVAVTHGSTYRVGDLID